MISKLFWGQGRSLYHHRLLALTMFRRALETINGNLPGDLVGAVQQGSRRGRGYPRAARQIASSSCSMVLEPRFATSGHRPNSTVWTANSPGSPALSATAAASRGWRAVRSAR